MNNTIPKMRAIMDQTTETIKPHCEKQHLVSERKQSTSLEILDSSRTKLLDGSVRCLSHEQSKFGSEQGYLPRRDEQIKHQFLEKYERNSDEYNPKKNFETGVKITIRSYLEQKTAAKK